MLPRLFTAVPVVLALAPGAAGKSVLEARLRAIGARAGGTVGASVVHIESGERVSIGGAERRPMFSVYKLPIAIHVLAMVDEGKLRLEQPVTLRPQDMRTGQSPLADRARGGSLTLPLRELVEAVVSVSDNTACDALLHLGGGTEAVTARLRALGFEAIRVDRPEVQIAAELRGVTLPPESEWTRAALERLLSGTPEPARRAALDRYLADPRDTATSDGLVDLLVRVHRRDLLKPETAALLVQALERTSTGPDRLPGRLPKGTGVAHKTGTGPTVGRLAAATNDVGIVTLPGNAGHLAIAVLVGSSEKSESVRDGVVAEIARAAYDRWTR